MTDVAKLDGLVDTVAANMSSFADSIRVALGQAHRGGVRDGLATAAEIADEIAKDARVCACCTAVAEFLRDHLRMGAHEVPDYVDGD